MKKIFELLKSQAPADLTRPSSILAIILAIVIGGFLTEAGARLFNGLYQLIEPRFPIIANALVGIFSFSIDIKVNLITIIFFVIIFFTFYRVIDRTVLKKLKNSKIFFDDFDFSNKGWELNYWGSNNPDKTCRYESSSLVFEAEESDLVDQKKEYGAYYDLVTGVYENNRYEISCVIRAQEGTTMGIKLWVHDMKGRNGIKYPANFFTPGENPEEIKVGFTGTSSQALRIHLHIKPGKGKIYVDSIAVIKK